jgi:hypothetical protein
MCGWPDLEYFYPSANTASVNYIQKGRHGTKIMTQLHRRQTINNGRLNCSTDKNMFRRRQRKRKVKYTRLNSSSFYTPTGSSDLLESHKNHPHREPCRPFHCSSWLQSSQLTDTPPPHLNPTVSSSLPASHFPPDELVKVAIGYAGNATLSRPPNGSVIRRDWR